MVLNQGWAQVGLASFLLPLHTHLSTVKSRWRLLKVGHSPRKLFATFHQFFGSKSVLWRSSPQRGAASKVGHCLPAVVTGLCEDSLGWWWPSSCPPFCATAAGSCRAGSFPSGWPPLPLLQGQHSGVLCFLFRRTGIFSCN